MKTLILQGDGMAGRPSPELQGHTPLQAASTPSLDFLARHGEFGLLKVPSEVTGFLGGMLTVSLLGYDPHKYFPGPGPFTGAGLEVVLGESDVAFLCSLVTLGYHTERAEGKKLGPQIYMEDDTAGRIETEEARELIDAVNEQLGSESIQFYCGKGHRHLMVWVSGSPKVTCCDPHEAVGKEVSSFLPTGDRADILKEWMEASRVILRNHPVNQEREAANLKPANCLWLWGPGKMVDLPKIPDRYRVSGAMVSQTDMHLGIGLCAGLTPCNPEDEAQEGEPSLDRYADLILQLLQKVDLVYGHLAEPSGMSASGSKDTLQWVEEVDQKILGKLLKEVSKFGDHQILVACNPWRKDSGGGEFPPTPFVLYDSRKPHDSGTGIAFNEVDACSSSTGSKDASRLLERLLEKN